MKDLILYPNEEEKINIEFNIIYPEQKYLPSISKNGNAKKMLKRW